MVDLTLQSKKGLPRMIPNVKEFLHGKLEWKKSQGGERKHSLSFSLCYKRVFSVRFSLLFLVIDPCEEVLFFLFVGSLGL